GSGRQAGQQDQQQQYLAHRRLSPSVVVQRIGPYQCEWWVTPCDAAWRFRSRRPAGSMQDHIQAR
ncbi:hypothetical protein, partial [Escherichia coli]|uniref:hypothetical protein n=1 Tax=Escherichia coli TaxID=562 RepID=UPI003BA01D29